MHLSPRHLPQPAIDFLTERHLATLTTLRGDGSPHVVAIAFTFDPGTGTARVITSGGSRKARNLARGGPAVLCQVDGRRWLTLEGRGTVVAEPSKVREAEERYAVRYRRPRPNPERVVIDIGVQRVMGHV